MKSREELNQSIKLNKDWKFKELFPTISAYTTAYNCIKNKYPLERALKSFRWVDELVVVDGGSTDGTNEMLEELQKEIPNLSVYQIPLDWENPGKDGAQKAMARAMCMSEFSIQFDADEICLGNSVKWKRMAKEMLCDILELPVLEPFGDIRKLRLNKEHNPVKWRITKNKSEITHGIPKHDRLEKNGKVFSKGMSDGCNFIHIVNEHPYPSKLSEKASEMKSAFLKFPTSTEYIDVVNEILRESEPAVLHLGHVNLKQKIKLFLNEWRHWWAALYDKNPDDLSMYWPDGISLSSAHEEVETRARELAEEIPTIEIFELAKYGDLTDGSEGRTV